MSQTSVPTRLGWLSRRSEALTEIVRFAAWSLRRMVSRERLVGTAAIVAVLAATPWILTTAGAWGWAWIAAVALGAVVYFSLLLISYIKLRMSDAGQRERAEHQALLALQAEREASARGDLATVVEAMQRRIASSVDAAALSQALRMNADRLDVMRGEMEARVEAVRQDMDARANTFTGALSEMRRAESSRRAELAALIQRAEQLVDQRARDQQQAMGHLRTELETWVRSELGSARAQSAVMGQTLEARLERERLEQEAQLSQTRQRLEQLLESQGEAKQATEYLRGLIDRRINAGADALRGELADLRSGLESMVQGIVAAYEPPVAKVLKEGLAEVESRVAALDGFRVEAAQSLSDQGQMIGAVRQQARKDAEAIKTLVAEESSARKSAVMALAAEQQKASPLVEARLAEVQGLIDQRMGPEFEARLEAWRARLDNEIASAVQAGRVEDQAAAREREAKLRAELKSLHDEILRQKSAGASKAELAALSDSVARVGGASEALEQFSRRLQAIDEERKAESAKLRATLEEVRKTPQPGVKPEVVEKLQERIAEINTRSNVSAQALRRMSDSNASIARPFDRLLAPDKVQKFETHWLKTFGINMSKTALAYMAHKICLLEDRGMGRIAAPIETIVMRQLALRSLPNRGKLEVLEIGNLFGLSAAVLYNFRGARSAGMHMTLLDPLEGYYEAGGLDPVTGVEVCEEVLRKNLADLDVPESDYRLIKALSADPRAISEASDRLYDFVLVDGDHSTAGVAADFENYGPLVKPGGLMIFDDYGSDHWPGIQPYVDETVRTDPNWIWIGADYRTAVVAKKADGATARVAPRTTARKPATRRAAKT